MRPTGERLLSQEVFNAVLVLVVVTSLLGSLLTELFAPAMIEEEQASGPSPSDLA